MWPNAVFSLPSSHISLGCSHSVIRWHIGATTTTILDFEFKSQDRSAIKSFSECQLIYIGDGDNDNAGNDDDDDDDRRAYIECQQQPSDLSPCFILFLFLVFAKRESEFKFYNNNRVNVAMLCAAKAVCVCASLCASSYITKWINIIAEIGGGTAMEISAQQQQQQRYEVDNDNGPKQNDNEL